MSDYGNDFVVLTDDEGNEYEFEHLDTLEQNGETYMAFIPAEMSLEDEAELVVLKLINEGTDDEMLASVDDEDELQSVFGIFLERLQNDEFYEDDDVYELEEMDGEDEEEEEND
ncbi:MAG: DUF1292 domain-containing protein [Clostridiaceae bacterium]|nr:DUF1292 domain-containing protein [Clostridiaceae bacterium]